jgi:hypothetical protein
MAVGGDDGPVMSDDDSDPWDRQAWQPLLDFVDELERERAAEATAGLDADADLDGWLSAMWQALGVAEPVLGPAWCAGGAKPAVRPKGRAAAGSRALPPRRGASRPRRDGT